MIGIDNTELQKLYIAYFGRPGDPSGINYWLSQSISNESLTLKKISYELSLQEEYIQNILNDSSFESQINRFYINLFGRKSNFNGLNYLLNMINKQKYKISDIVYFLLYENRANEFFEFSQLEKDLFILDNKVFAAKIFTQQIHKSISLVNLYQPDSISPWSSGNSLIKASEFISNISSQKVTVQDVNNFIESLSGNSLTILTQPAIEMENISLSIPIYCLENRSLSKSITNKVTNLTGGKLTESKNGTNIVALNNINLTIMKGERIALIGHNGSGKSSFLRLISGIYMPTNGRIMIDVDVYPMLQKTFLTSPELNGIDACKAHYLLKNHSLIGFDTFLNEIIDFSGLGSYISLPIKTYSEGMSARLIFSILTSSPHDCLAIDEGFGTGDSDFCDRAEERMKKFMDSAATLFLASHSEELLKQFCNRGIVFSHGSIVFDGSLDAALNYYHTHDYYNINVIK
tara:strand:+ start:2037 stop:3419 length:1383 start_codon:yes stop_codon:yes gene_type:complete